VSELAASLLVPGRSGRPAGLPGLIVRECVGLSLASLIARRGQAELVSKAAFATFGVALPVTPRAVAASGFTFSWAGPGSWFVEATAGAENLEAVLGASFGGVAAICEQSDSRVVLEVAGTRVRDVLAKGVPIDLHPERFRDGDVALTVVGHVGIQLRRTNEVPSYRLSVARSYFGSLWHWLAASAAEFGCEVIAPDEGPAASAGG
jgi:heterotetrameric sarcosine oxidase gamma subunit